MPVNFPTISAHSLYPVAGVFLGKTQAGIRKAGRDDVLVITLPPGSNSAGVFTQNRYCAAPVLVCRQHLSHTAPRAFVINTGCANAGTGRQGMADALATCDSLAALLNCPREAVLPFSTGVIMEFLPLAKLQAALPLALDNPTDWIGAARTIMTTDTEAKAASRRFQLGGQTVTISGIAKGAGMIHPNMATMLAFIACDLALPQPLLQQLLQEVSAVSFNAITVDGDTSTNDSFILSATGKVVVPSLTPTHPDFAGDYQILYNHLRTVAQDLAQMIVRDGEGATKFITINVKECSDKNAAEKIARAIAHSPLVKTAFFASDPNLGRILAAVGYAGVAIDVSRIRLSINGVTVVTQGERDPHYREEDGAQAMQASDITIDLSLGTGQAATTLWTCDLSNEYVSINAAYRS